VLSPDGTLLEVNATALQVGGVARDAVIGKPLANAPWWSYSDRSQAWIRGATKVAAAGKHIRSDVLLRTGGDHIGWFDFSLSPARDAAGKVTHLVSVAIDVAKRKQLEMELRDSEERLRLAVDGANIGLWDWELSGEEVHYSSRWKKQLGYSDEELPNTLDTFWQLVHPEDKTALTQRMDDFRRVGAGDYRAEFRMRHKNGEYRWILAQASLLKDPAGRPLHMLGAHVDITERKQSEDDADARARQQAEIAALGIDALSGLGVSEVMRRAAQIVAEMLNVEYSQVLELQPQGQRLLLRAGEGWPAGTVGKLELDAGHNSHAGYVMLSNEPVIIEDLSLERRFIVEPLLSKCGVVSGISTLIRGHKGNYGVLAGYTGARRRFPDDDLNFLQSVANVIANSIEKSRHENELFDLAHHDELTGLPNRRFMQSRLHQILAHAPETGDRVALLQFDLDHFKVVNDSYGQATGDALLKAVAERIGVCLNPGDTLCRLSEDEFAVILYPIAGSDWVTTVAQTILGIFAEPFAVAGHEVLITATIGIGVSSDTAESADALIREASIALARGKETGRNCFRFFTAEMEKESQRWNALQAGLQRAVVQDEFRLVFQPQVDLTIGRIVGAEALLRWRSATLGEVSPNEFIPVAEATGLIDPIGKFVLRNACRQIQEWQAMGYSGMRVAINLSARQFKQQELAQRLLEIVRHAGVEAKALELEISEEDIMADAETAARTLLELNAAGFRIAIDDVGTGFSSLAQLKRFKIDALKIDRSFVHDLMTNPDAAAVTKSIIGVAHSMNLTVIAEGVETEQQLNFLRRYGCNVAQGLFFSAIVPPAEITSMLVTGKLAARAMTSTATRGSARRPF
jgi:diguanylate cyclase (GGDEF)-like protein/PAS domain S-box-containing protein